MTRECWKMREIVSAEKEQDELKERLRIQSVEYKAKDREVEQRTDAMIWVWKMTMVKTKKDLWSILCCLVTNGSVSTAQIMTDNSKNFVGHKKKPTSS